MDENERRTLITDSIWWWLPARWENAGSWYEVLRYELVEEGVDVYVTKDSGSEVAVRFVNDECLGELKILAESARGRIYDEVV